MLLWVLRAAFAALLIGVALFAFNLFERTYADDNGGFAYGAAAGGVVLAAGVLVLLVDLRGAQKQIATISAVFFGLLLGCCSAGCSPLRSKRSSGPRSSSSRGRTPWPRGTTAAWVCSSAS